MGTFLTGLDDHEGYAARRLPDGTLTGMWTHETREFTAYVAACDCASGDYSHTEWYGTTEHPPTDAGEQAAIDEWERVHAGPLLAPALAARQADADRERALLQELGLLDYDGRPDTSAIIGRFWPEYGSPPPDTIAAAGLAVEQLLRYLAAATFGDQALPYAPLVYRLVGELRAGFGHLDQILAQLSERATGLGGDRTLYDDRHPTRPAPRSRPGRPDPHATATARELAGSLDAARVALGPLVEAFAAAHGAAGHLGHHT